MCKMIQCVSHSFFFFFWLHSGMLEQRQGTLGPLKFWDDAISFCQTYYMRIFNLCFDSNFIKNRSKTHSIKIPFNVTSRSDITDHITKSDVPCKPIQPIGLANKTEQYCY